MAVALDIGWGCSSPTASSFCMSNKRGWGQDHHKLLQLMIGQPSPSVDQDAAATTTTLDLLGGSCSSSTSSEKDEHDHDKQQILQELDMDLPPPAGWEKRLDLKLGKFYYVDLITGKSTYENPRASLLNLSSGKSTYENPLLALSTTRKSTSPRLACWDLQSELDKVDTRELLSTRKRQVDSEELLELKLNSSCSSPLNKNRGAVSTIQAVQDAMRGSAALTVLLGGRGGIMSPSTSTSSSTTSSSSRPNCQSSASEKSTSSKYRAQQQQQKQQQQHQVLDRATKGPKVVLTGCKRCLMYVMLTQSDPRCPKCGTSLGIDMPLQQQQQQQQSKYKKPRLELDLL